MNVRQGKKVQPRLQIEPDAPALTGAHDRNAQGQLVPGHSMGRWLPGQSGNPSGRPASEKELIAICREFSVEGAKLLMDIARDTRAQAVARVTAINTLQERGYGKAPQKVIVETDVAALNNEALAAYIRGALEQASRTIEGEVDSDA